MITIEYSPEGLAHAVHLDLTLYGIVESAAEWKRQLSEDLREAGVEAFQILEADLHTDGNAWRVKGPLDAQAAHAIRLTGERTDAPTWRRYGANRYRIPDDMDHAATWGTHRE